MLSKVRELSKEVLHIFICHEKSRDQDYQNGITLHPLSYFLSENKAQNAKPKINREILDKNIQ